MMTSGNHGDRTVQAWPDLPAVTESDTSRLDYEAYKYHFTTMKAYPYVDARVVGLDEMLNQTCVYTDIFT